MLIGHLGESDQHAAGALMRFFCLWGTITKSMLQSGSLELRGKDAGPYPCSPDISLDLIKRSHVVCHDF